MDKYLQQLERKVYASNDPDLIYQAIMAFDRVRNGPKVIEFVNLGMSIDRIEFREAWYDYNLKYVKDFRPFYYELHHSCNDDLGYTKDIGVIDEASVDLEELVEILVKEDAVHKIDNEGRVFWRADQTPLDEDDEFWIPDGWQQTFIHIYYYDPYSKSLVSPFWASPEGLLPQHIDLIEQELEKKIENEEI